MKKTMRDFTLSSDEGVPATVLFESGAVASSVLHRLSRDLGISIYVLRERPVGDGCHVDVEIVGDPARVEEVLAALRAMGALVEPGRRMAS